MFTLNKILFPVVTFQLVTLFSTLLSISYAQNPKRIPLTYAFDVDMKTKIPI